MTLTTRPFQGQFVIGRLGHAMVNQLHNYSQNLVDENWMAGCSRKSAHRKSTYDAAKNLLSVIDLGDCYRSYRLYATVTVCRRCFRQGSSAAKYASKRRRARTSAKVHAIRVLDGAALGRLWTGLNRSATTPTAEGAAARTSGAWNASELQPTTDRTTADADRITL